MFPTNERRTSLSSKVQCDTCNNKECRYWEHGNRFFDGEKHKCGQCRTNKTRDFVDEHYEEMKRKNRPAP